MSSWPVALLFLLALSAVTNATVQRKEGILVGGEKGMIEESPLGSLLRQRKLVFLEYSTGNYAGYGADWEIRGGRLLLTGFIGNTSEGERGLDWLFPDAKGPIVATWYSGILHAGIGKVNDSILMGHIPIKESLIVIHVESGKLVSSQRYEYPKNISVLRKKDSGWLGDDFPLDSEIHALRKRMSAKKGSSELDSEWQALLNRMRPKNRDAEQVEDGDAEDPAE